MDERSITFVDQLLEKTKEGKLSWTPGFEDGQFKTVLPGGKLAFVVQVNGQTFRFAMLDDNQEEILRESVTPDEVNCGGVTHPQKARFFRAIDELSKLARVRAMQVNEKLVQAEKLLAEI